VFLEDSRNIGRLGFRECATESFLEARARFPRIRDAHGSPRAETPRVNWPAPPPSCRYLFGQRRAETRHVRGYTWPWLRRR